MGATEKRVLAFAAQAHRLHPRGLASVFPEGSVRAKFWEGMSRLAADVEARSFDLAKESDSRTATELLEEWEKEYGLPNPCDTFQQTTILRRASLFAKVTAIGGQSRAYMIEIAAALGYAITIEEHPAMVVGRTVGSGGVIGGRRYLPGRLDVTTSTGHWTYTWTVHAPTVSPMFARVSESTVGDPLMEATNEPLECHLELIKPAHTRIQFVYDLPFEGYAPWETVEPSAAVAELNAPAPLLGT